MSFKYVHSVKLNIIKWKISFRNFFEAEDVTLVKVIESVFFIVFAYFSAIMCLIGIGTSCEMSELRIECTDDRASVKNK